jgi:ketohexokinase
MLSLPNVSSELFQFRKDQPLAASSYIIQSAQNQSRTIVSANPLEEMTVEEFKTGVAPLIDDPKIGNDDVWVHFEGRVPEVLLPCVTWLRETYGYKKKVKISLECEKPDRVGLKDVVPLADLVFYSKIWAEVRPPTTSRMASEW